MGTIGYKQTITHVNDMPTIKTKIINMSNLYRYKDGSQQRNQPDRYYFDVTVNGGGLMSAYKHACYFDNKEDAENKHKDLCLKFYDQETQPYLKKIKSNHFLSTKDKDKIFKIMDKIDNLKKVDEVILR